MDKKRTSAVSARRGRPERVPEFQTKIDELNAEVVSLREQLFKTRDELHSLKNARLLGKIIKTRDFVGSASRKVVSAPRRTVHGLRVVIAPSVPKPVRKGLKVAYKRTRERLQGGYAARTRTAQITRNTSWSEKGPLVSVVIPYYNRANTIDDTLDSLRAQTFKDFEITLVNDGSPDPNSVQKLKEIAVAAPEIKIIEQINQGVSAARNNGIKQARGKYIICLDSDDMLEETFVEKAALVLETHPDISLITTHQDMFGVINEVHQNSEYDPLKLYRDNMVITAAMFRKEAWAVSGGYRSGIGYEDWDFWLRLAEHGFWGKRIPEELFLYRTSLLSRYVEDKDVHWNNIKAIKALHPGYKQNIKALLADKRRIVHSVDPATALINIRNKSTYRPLENGKKNVLIALPWMTFGGAETLVLNLCRELKEQYNLSFVTGLSSEHEWGYKFKEISPYVYHLPELLGNTEVYADFISDYIATRQVDIVHMVHTNFMFSMLEDLCARHPEVKFIVTMFNDRVPEYFGPSVELHDLIDAYSTDNMLTANHYRQDLPTGKTVELIPNGIDCTTIFSPLLFDRETQRAELGIEPDEAAVFFIGRLSSEKNPDVFVAAAKQVLTTEVADKTRFFMVGDGNMRAQVEKQIKDAKTTRIIDLGYRSDIAALLSAADIFVLPSAIEGFPLSILEAMAMKVVPIASDVGAVADVIETGRTGFVVSPGSADEVSKRVVQLCKDRALLDKMKLQARLEVEAKYSSVVLGTNYRKMYKGVLS